MVEKKVIVFNGRQYGKSTLFKKRQEDNKVLEKGLVTKDLLVRVRTELLKNMK